MFSSRRRFLEGFNHPHSESSLDSAGTVVLQALYDYKYKSEDGRQVIIEEGEIFHLVHKANEDWWQVKRFGQTKQKRPIFVPASYVAEVTCDERASLQQNVFLHPSYHSEKDGGPACLEMSHSLEDLWGQPPPSSSHTDLLSSCNHFPAKMRIHQLFLGRRHSLSGLSQVKCKGPKHWQSSEEELARSERYYGMLDDTPPSLLGEKPPIYYNLEEMKQLSTTPPSPCSPPLQTLEAWERHIDSSSLCSYYYKPATGEKSWKPPRRIQEMSLVQIEGNGLSAPADPMPEATQDQMEDRVGREQPGAQGLHKKLGYTKSFMLPEMRPPKGNHRRNHSQYSCQAWLGEYSAPSSINGSISDNAELLHVVEKCGQLNKTKIAEGGRKLRKCFETKLSASLMFYKDPKVTAAWTPSGSRPESSVDLRGARIEWARDLSSKRNVIHFRTVTGNEYLLQSDNEAVSQDWYQAIKGVIHRLDQENPLDEPLLYPLYRSNSAELVDFSWDDEEEVGLSKSEVPAAPGSPGRVYKKRVRSKLRRFIAKRPPLRSLQEKGLIRDQVFGCRLEALCQREGGTVPRFVQQCVEAVEERGLDADGIYRVNGNLATIQKLRFIVDRERAVTSDGRYVFPEQRCQEEKLNLASPQWDDVHVITGALKLFFRELPESLVPYSHIDEFIASVKISDHEEKVSKLTGLIQSLPQPNRDTLRYLLQHLRKVMDHSDTNRMTSHNIGIVFGPTLLRHERDIASLIEDMVYQNQVVEMLLTEFASIFETGAE
ncbi:LOW QUALITY PROTEIN: rho GTPase-activating protein 9 [Vipera latastei]